MNTPRFRWPKHVSNSPLAPPDPHALNPVSARELPAIVAAHEAYLARRPGGRRASLKFRDLSGLDLTACRLAEADLSGACLRDCRMVRTNLRGANLFGADLTRVDLPEAVLADADMRGVAMNDARLIRTDLTRVDLRDGVLMAAYAGDIRQTQTGSAAVVRRKRTSAPQVTVSHHVQGERIKNLLPGREGSVNALGVLVFTETVFRGRTI